MIRLFRYRLYPNKQQERVLNGHLAICCELHNAAIQERRDAWSRARKSISWFDQNLQLTEIRRERADVEAVHVHALTAALRRVDLAFKAFFRRVKNGEKPGYPRFRPLARYNSLTFRTVTKLPNSGKLAIPKIGNVRLRLHRPLTGSIKTLTIKREAGRWFAVFATEITSNPLVFNPNAVGIDVGIRSFAALSNGATIENPRWFVSAEQRLRRLQRRVARRKPSSNRRRKASASLQRFHNHIGSQRHDFHHKESHKIVNANGLIAVEDLNIKGMVRNHSLAKSIHDAGWANFLFMLAYKAESAGRVFVKVSPRGTSQTCVCGAAVPKTLKQREHICESCGLVANRDHVSAQIILARSLPSGANVADLIASVA